MKIALFIPMTPTQAKEIEHAWPFDWDESVTASVLRWPELNSFEAPPDRYDMFPLFDEEVADGVQMAIALDKKHGFSHMIVVSRSTAVYHRLRLLMVTGVLSEVRIYLAYDSGQSTFDLSADGSIKPEDEPRFPRHLFVHSAAECTRLIRAHVARAERRRAAYGLDEPRIAPRDVRFKAVEKYDDRIRLTGTSRADGQSDLT